jgi:aminomethyltransferase
MTIAMNEIATPSLKTPLFDEHVKLNARIVEFAGWQMPIQYTSLKEEHNATRNHVGLFDVSHMGEIRVKGAKAVESLQWLTTNDVSKLENGQAQYGLLPNDKGGLVDDLFIYCLEKNADYLVCVNASNKDKDFAWMTKHNKGADITDESDKWGQIAIQGPNALELCDRVFGFKVSEMKSFTVHSGKFQGHNIMIATTGYTGEKGVMHFVNYCQILKRRGCLTDECIEGLRKLLLDETVMPMTKVGVSLLLGEKDTFNHCLDLLFAILQNNNRLQSFRR